MGKIFEIFNFDNIGQKIKNLSKWLCWISILIIWISAPITFIVMISNDAAELCWIPLVIALVAPVLIWVGSWTMYAFGELVDNSSVKDDDDDDGDTVPVAKPVVKPQTPTAAFYQSQTKSQKTEWYADKKSTDDDGYFDVKCPNCGETLSFTKGTSDAECPWCNQPIKIN